MTYSFGNEHRPGRPLLLGKDLKGSQTPKIDSQLVQWVAAMKGGAAPKLLLRMVRDGRQAHSAHHVLAERHMKVAFRRAPGECG